MEAWKRESMAAWYTPGPHRIASTHPHTAAVEQPGALPGLSEQRVFSDRRDDRTRRAGHPWLPRASTDSAVVDPSFRTSAVHGLGDSQLNQYLRPQGVQRGGEGEAALGRFSI
jgi:hypothetical protein